MHQDALNDGCMSTAGPVQLFREKQKLELTQNSQIACLCGLEGMVSTWGTSWEPGIGKFLILQPECVNFIWKKAIFKCQLIYSGRGPQTDGEVFVLASQKQLGISQE